VQRPPFDISIASLSHEALQKVFRSAFIAHIREVFHVQFEDAWRSQLVGSFGQVGWAEIVSSVERGMASGSRDAPPVDEFDFLDVADLHAVVAKHFAVVFPDLAALGERARGDARQTMLRRLKAITDARNVIAHPTVADLSDMDAVVAMEDARRLLRRFDPVAAAKVEELELEVLRRSPRLALKETPVAPQGDDPFLDLWLSLGSHEFFVLFVKFMHDLTDMFDEGLEEDARAGGLDVFERDWPIGPEEVALAVLKWFLFQPYAELDQLQEPPDDDKGA
jgi:hypothetical protein